MRSYGRLWSSSNRHMHMNSDADTRRKGWIAAGIVFAAWVATTSYVGYRVFVVGLSPDHQQAADQFVQQPFQALTEPIFALLFTTTLLAGTVVFAVLYLAYERWRYAHLERLAVEYETLENDRD